MKTGCKHHDDCFTCPFPDCICGDNPELESYNANYYREHRDQILQRRKKWREDHREELAARRRERRAAKKREAEQEKEVPV